MFDRQVADTVTAYVEGERHEFDGRLTATELKQRFDIPLGQDVAPVVLRPDGRRYRFADTDDRDIPLGQSLDDGAEVVVVFRERPADLDDDQLWRPHYSPIDEQYLPEHWKSAEKKE